MSIADVTGSNVDVETQDALGPEDPWSIDPGAVTFLDGKPLIPPLSGTVNT